jgi:hypothetical protein
MAPDPKTTTTARPTATPGAPGTPGDGPVGATTIGPAVTRPAAKAPSDDFEALASFLLEQTTAAFKQGEEVVGVARKQMASNIAHAESFALETIGKWRELTGTFPTTPAWTTPAGFGSAALFGFDVAEQILAAERRIAQSMLDLFVPASVA